MQWIYQITLFTAVIGFLVGLIQITIRSKDNIVQPILKLILIIIIVLLIIFGRLIVFFYALAFSPEHIVTKNGQKLVGYSHGFRTTYVDYYKYVNSFVREINKVLYEDYGEGGFDPFNESHSESKPEKYYYYDNDGNVIETNEKNNIDYNSEVNIDIIPY